MFAELVGAGSFAGEHVAGDAKSLVLFDIEQIGSGLLAPDVFTRACTGLPTPRVLFQGKFSGQLVEDIRRGLYNVVEGAVIKGVGNPWRAKVKTDAYQARLKALHGERWRDFWE